MAEKITISIDEVAGMLGISRSYAYEQAQARRFPVRQMGRRVLIPKEEFLAWWKAGIEMPQEKRGLRLAR